MSCNICEKEQCHIRKDYNKIMQAWIDGKNHNDIYHMILRWIENQKYRDKDMEDIYNRMRNGDETNDIVENFIYGSKYEKLRSKFKV